MGFIRMAVTFIRIDPIVKPSQNGQTSTAKIRLIRCSVRLRDRTFLWRPRWDEAIALRYQAQFQQQPCATHRNQAGPKSSGTAKKKKLLFRIDFRELAIGKFAQKWRKVGGYGGVLQSPHCHLWPNQLVETPVNFFDCVFPFCMGAKNHFKKVFSFVPKLFEGGVIFWKCPLV